MRPNSSSPLQSERGLNSHRSRHNCRERRRVVEGGSVARRGSRTGVNESARLAGANRVCSRTNPSVRKERSPRRCQSIADSKLLHARAPTHGRSLLHHPPPIHPFASPPPTQRKNKFRRPIERLRFGPQPVVVERERQNEMGAMSFGCAVWDQAGMGDDAHLGCRAVRGTSQ